MKKANKKKKDKKKVENSSRDRSSSNVSALERMLANTNEEHAESFISEDPYSERVFKQEVGLKKKFTTKDSAFFKNVLRLSYYYLFLQVSGLMLYITLAVYSFKDKEWNCLTLPLGQYPLDRLQIDYIEDCINLKVSECRTDS